MEGTTLANLKVSIIERIKVDGKWTSTPVPVPKQKPNGKGVYLKDFREGKFLLVWREDGRKRYSDYIPNLKDWEVRSYISEPERGRRRWTDNLEAQPAVYGNRRRITGEHGKQLLRCRGELVERSFAHAYATGGMRRVHLRGRENIFKRVLIHLSGFNLSLLMRQRTGKGTPPGWQGYSANECLAFLRIWMALLAQKTQEKQPAPQDQRMTAHS